MPGGELVRRGLRWLDRRETFNAVIRASRELLPGDARFGDPLSTAGPAPAQLLARRAWSASDGRWSSFAELGLAALQVADWVAPDLRGIDSEGEVAVLFTDLVRFSSWAMRAGDLESLALLREVDARVTAAIEDAGGAVVKRLGDGTMAVFEEPWEAVRAASEAILAAPAAKVDGYTPTLRAGLHFGSPRLIGNDFIGVDVTVAARLCEAASANEVLMTDKVAGLLDGGGPEAQRRPSGNLRGVPRGLDVYAIKLDRRRHRVRTDG